LYWFWGENDELGTKRKIFCRHGLAANDLNYEKISLFIRLALLGFFFFCVFDFEALLFFDVFAILVVRILLRLRPRNFPIRFCVDSVKRLDII
jgi:hypothetical protein